MAYETVALDSALAAAVGDDPVLVAELRAVFLESVARQADALTRARDESGWRTAAWRLKGLAASFGATKLMDAAEEATSAPVGDPDVLRRIAVAIAMLDA